MKVTGPTASFDLGLAIEAGLSAEGVDELTVKLRRELLESDVVDVPRRPAQTDGIREEELAALVTRDTMIGVAQPIAPTPTAA